MGKDLVVSVRIPEDDLRKLQLFARVLEQPVGSLIRTSVRKHIDELSGNEEFREKAVKMQREWDEVLAQLRKPRSSRKLKTK